MTVDRRLRFVGPFDARCGRELEQIATFVVRRGWTGPPATVHVDLSLVTRLDATALQALNRAWVLLGEAGWSMEIIEPDQGSARWPFVDAAVRGELAWARGSGALEPLVRTGQVKGFSAG